MHRALLTVAGLSLALGLAACSSPSLHQRDTRSVGRGKTVDASATAAMDGRPVHLMTPAGRVDLTVGDPKRTVDGAAVDGDRPLRASSGTRLVGVSWVLQRAAYPDAPNRQLTEPSAIFGEAQPVRLWLVTDGARHEIGSVDNLTAPAHRPSNAVWMSVPDSTKNLGLALDYGGVTQTVDTRSGKVTAGRAAALYDGLPSYQHGYCDTRPDSSGGCLLDYAVGYPYVSGAGWAPTGRTWLLLRASIDEDFDAAQHLTVAGSSPRAAVGESAEIFTPFLVDADATSFTLSGHTSAETLDHGTARVRVSATLTRSRS